MSAKKNLSIAILEASKTDDINNIISKYGTIAMQPSSHLLFDMEPVTPDEIRPDITIFRIEAENETLQNKKLESLIDDLNQLNTGYTLMDEDSKEMIVSFEFVCALDIKFDNLKIIKEGTYKKIDELKLLKSDLGFCKGYKPYFRAIEGISIENTDIQPETIYILTHSSEALLKIKDCLSEKIMKIDPNFEIGLRLFTEEPVNLD